MSEKASATAASEAAFAHALEFAKAHSRAASEKARDAAQRVMAIERRRRENPDGTINLPRVFDKQLFFFAEVAGLTLGHAARESGQGWQSAAKVVEPALRNAAEQAGLNAEKALAAEQKTVNALQRSLACIDGCATKCGSDSDCLTKCVDACKAKAAEEIERPEREAAEAAYRGCKETRNALEVSYAQHFAVWKHSSDSLRVAARDFYAFSDPYLKQIWVPALFDLLDANRELAVMTLYQQSAGLASALAGTAKGIKDLKCVEPPPPQPAKKAADPTLKKTKPECPLNPPLSWGIGALGFSLGCESFSVSGGEVLRFKYERNFVKKESAAYIGVGAAVAAGFDLGSGTGLGENPNGWTPPGLSGGVSVSAEIMIGIKTSDAGGLQDVSLTSSVAASGSAGIASGSVGVTGSLSLENGANLAPNADFGMSAGTIAIPGLPAVSVTPPWK